MVQKRWSTRGSVIEHLHIKFLVRQAVYTHEEGEAAFTGASGARYSSRGGPGTIGVYWLVPDVVG